MGFDLLVITWLIALSGFVSFVAWTTRRLQLRTQVLDLGEQLHYINRHITLDMIRRDNQLEIAVHNAIQCFEENKILMDKHWQEYHALKQLARR